MGLVVPKHGRSAVQRNVLKRRLRELSRIVLLPDAPAIDIVVHARPSAYALDFAALSALVTRLQPQIRRVARTLLSDGDRDTGPTAIPPVM